MACNPSASPLNISSQTLVLDFTKNDTGLLSSLSGGSVTVTLRKDAHPEEPEGMILSMVPYLEVDAHCCSSSSRGERAADVLCCCRLMVVVECMKVMGVNASDVFWRKRSV